MISDDDVRHLAALSNINLSEKETKSLKTDLGQILAYIGQLDELDVSGVEPTYQVVDLQNVWREDEIQDYGVSREDLLVLTAEQAENQIKVPKVL